MSANLCQEVKTPEVLFAIILTTLGNKLIWIFVGGALLLMGLVIACATINDSPTSDEPPHILSGYVFLRFGHDFIDPEHPLLAKSLAAAPLLFANLAFDATDSRYTQQRYIPDVGKMFDNSRDFLAFSGNDPSQILFWSRLPMILLTCFFGLVVFILTRKLFGTLAGALALILYASEPFFLGHGSLTNTDIAAAGFVLTTVYALILYAQAQSPKRLAFLTLALSATLLSKFSTFYLAPLTILLMVYIFWVKKRWLLIHLAILITGVVSSISLFYGLFGFRDTGLWAFIPARYLGGLTHSITSLSNSNRFSYLLGESYFGSRIYYFPILLLLKTQLLTVLGAALGVILIILKKIKLSRDELVVFFVPFLVFLLLALNAKFNIGIRHVSPVYPFIIILAAATFAWMGKVVTRFVPKQWQLSTIGLLILVILSFRIYSVVTTYPHFLSYYNIVAGGTDNGWKVANDSNYDWGQDVGRLADFVRENDIKLLAFDNYTGTYAASDYYNLPVFQFSPDQTNYKGYLALSTSVITFHEDKPTNYSWVVDNYKPIAKAGKSIFIYKIE